MPHLPLHYRQLLRHWRAAASRLAGPGPWTRCCPAAGRCSNDWQRPRAPHGPPEWLHTQQLATPLSPVATPVDGVCVRRDVGTRGEGWHDRHAPGMPARPAWRHGRRRAPARPRGRRVKTPCRTPRTWRAQSHAGPESITCEFEVCAGSTQEERTWPTSKCSCLSFARPAGVEATAGGTLAVSPVTASPACVDLDRTAGGSLDASVESVRHKARAERARHRAGSDTHPCGGTATAAAAGRFREKTRKWAVSCAGTAAVAGRTSSPPRGPSPPAGSRRSASMVTAVRFVTSSSTGVWAAGASDDGRASSTPRVCASSAAGPRWKKAAMSRFDMLHPPPCVSASAQGCQRVRQSARLTEAPRRVLHRRGA